MVCFKAKRTTPFRKLMKAYCERQGVFVVGSLRRRGRVLCLRPGSCVPATSQAGHQAHTCAQDSPWRTYPSSLKATVCGALCSYAEWAWFCLLCRSLSRVHLLVRREDMTPNEVLC